MAETETTATAEQTATTAASTETKQETTATTTAAVNPFADGKWINDLPEEYRNETVLKTFSDPASMAKQLIHQSRLIGKQGKGVEAWLPNEKSKPEEVLAFQKAIGVPDTAEGYKYEAPAELAKEVLAPEAVKPFLEAMHKAGARPAEVKAALDYYGQLAMTAKQAQAEADVKAAQDTEATLKQEWGKDYDTNNTLASRVIAECVDEKDRPVFVAMAQRNPAMARALASLGRNFLDDKPVNTDGEGGQTQAGSEIDALLKTPGYLDGKLRETNRREHDQITEKLNLLYRKKFPATVK